MKSLFLLLASLPLTLAAQMPNWKSGTTWFVEAQTTTSSRAVSPLWLNANRHGVGSTDGKNGHLRFQIHRSEKNDSARSWQWGYGADAIVGYGQQQTLYLQQLYINASYGLSRFTLGQEQRMTELNHPTLSTGAFLLGKNARPIPMASWALRDWWNISGSANNIALKLRVGYGLQTDGAWQRKYLSPGSAAYPMWALYHEKAGYLRLGNPERHSFTFIGGLEMATQFGGTIYNAGTWSGTMTTPLRVGYGWKGFVYALLGKGGSDATDGKGYGNSAGNTLGAWRASFNYQPRHFRWSARLYYDHFFEDQSQMFQQYGWLDGLIGAEITLPRNKLAHTLVVEHLRTDYQSGPIYHDHTPQIPDQISGADNYYNHNLYQGWQNYGMAMGNALFASPLYDKTPTLQFSATRFHATHIGIAGTPLPLLQYRLLYSYLKTWGTYALPLPEVERRHHFLFEATYSLPSGWTAKAALGFDRGAHWGNVVGAQLSIQKSGKLFP